MMVKYLLPKSNIQAVSEVLFPLGRKVDWEMQAMNGVSEELTLDADDLSLHKQILQLCPFTSDYQRDRLRKALDQEERAAQRDAKKAALLAKIHAAQQAREKRNALYGIERLG